MPDAPSSSASLLHRSRDGASRNAGRAGMSKASILGKVLPWRGVSSRSRLADTAAEDELPLRAELFSSDQMALHAEALAVAHTLANGRAPDMLLPRLADNERCLIEICERLTASVSAKRRITPAAEWLFDNFYLIEEQIQTARKHLPKGYSQSLPRLSTGPSAGRPRVYGIALEIISHGDGRVDEEVISRFVMAYQGVTVLKLGELWATPIMLRLAVIENLRRVGAWIAAAWRERTLAGTWADSMIEAAQSDPKSLILVVADMARSAPPMSSAFVAELVRRLQGQGPALTLPLTWLEQRLSESGATIAQMVQLENQQQATDQVSISNSIGSLRMLGAMNWREFVERMSLVERALHEDPGDTYAHMDFATRDRYRHAVESLALRSPRSEEELAWLAVALAKKARCEGAAPPADHVGFYLIDAGLPALELAAEARPGQLLRGRRMLARHPLQLYLGSIALLTAVLTWLLFAVSGADLALAGPTLNGWWYALAAPAILVASQCAIGLVNWLATLLVPPRALPRMDFSHGIPEAPRSLVVVPTMLTSQHGIESLADALEIRFLANRDEGVLFGLLTDFSDAATEHLPQDEALLNATSQHIEALNEKYAVSGRRSCFYLFHRARRWNPQEKVWMGYERKRGKLADLNHLLRDDVAGHGQAAFSRIVGDLCALSGIRYVITLDTDTQLPRDTVRQFVGAMAHPLNRARYDAGIRRVVSGYGILQPRVAISLPGTNRSRYARLYGGEPGLDPYTRATSDVYQDVFGEGSFIGKGIYDVDAFRQVMEGQFPDNRILSHDLLEGCYARSGLLSDVQLYEDFPMRYHADVSRRRRWIRGDWQLAGWLWRVVPKGMANPLSALSQWKLLDNLRRSLVPAALLLLFVAGWAVLPHATTWTLLLLGIVWLPALCAWWVELLRKPRTSGLRSHVSDVMRSAWRRGKQLGFELACLPYEAFFSMDAILRTLWRLLVTRRHLLEWNASTDAERAAATPRESSLPAAFRRMGFAPGVAVAAALFLAQQAYAAPASIAAPLAAAPLLLLWGMSPLLAWWVSRPLDTRSAPLNVEQSLFLRGVARRTWAFFDKVMGPADNWLPPDNVQEYRAAAMAHRTSPTNMGMALLANLAAYDFGYLPAGKLIERCANTLHTMQGLARFRGHFYNWYDTQTLQAMPPLYVSAVDSGNLAGHLLTLHAGLLALPDERIAGPSLFDGLSDTFKVWAELQDGTLSGPASAFLQALESARDDPGCPLRSLHRRLVALDSCADRLLRDTPEAPFVLGDPPSYIEGNEQEERQWADSLSTQCRDALDELYSLAPWLSLAPPPPGFADCTAQLLAVPSLRRLARLDTELLPILAAHQAASGTASEHAWLVAMQVAVASGSTRARERMQAIDALAQQALALTWMEQGFLFDEARHLLSIGYKVSEHRADAGFYDLLASEARLGCFVAIAQGQLPQESWFSLGRLLTTTGGDPVLLSWSGSMFEYLMPLLVMPTYANTLLDQTCKAAVARQIEYGRQRGVPWGISESAYNTVDVQLNYQYRAFGVPGLGLKRGLAEDLVVAPYASVLALMVAPREACLNLQRMAAEGFLGKFGFFEAIDFTPARQRRGQQSVAVRAFMAHHQGMSLLALAYVLLDRPMQRRFEAYPPFQANLLLLQERIPRTTTLFAHTARRFDMTTTVTTETPVRVLTRPDTPTPEVQLLSNGRYHVMLTQAGGGYSRWKELAVTRWREDGTCDNWGSFCYLHDLRSGRVWSTAYQPTRVRPLRYAATFCEGRAEYHRIDTFGPRASEDDEDASIETHTEIVVSPEDDIELRRVRLTNRSRQTREIALTTYAEVAIASQAEDVMHPAFSNLFVHTEILHDRNAILCHRRPRSRAQPVPWMLHQLVVRTGERNEGGEVSFETDRARFIGRTRDVATPAAMDDAAALSGTAGAVLDPIVAIRTMLRLGPEQSIVVDIVSGMADTRDAALSLIDKYQDRHLADRVFDLAWTHSQVVLRQLNASEAGAQLHARLAGSVIYANPSLRADAAVLIRNRRGQSALWGYSISGDLPIVLLRIGDAANIEIVRQLVQAHAYWRLKGVAADLVIWNEDRAGYRQQLQDQIVGLIASGAEGSVMDRPGGIFVRSAEQLSEEDRLLFQAVARVLISDGRGGLAEQLENGHRTGPPPPALVARRPAYTEARIEAPRPAPPPLLDNGLGGFTPDGREYVIDLAPGQVTPMPWANVLANPHFGCIVSESGLGHTWGENAHAFRLSPWHNDPLCDTGGEAIYLRDEESGEYWSPTPLPCPGKGAYRVRHGFGYSVYETESHGIRSELWVYVALDAAIKFSVLKLANTSDRPRRLSATSYVEWVLGDVAAKSAMHISTGISAATGALHARNPYSMEFSEQVAFVDVDEPARTISGDRNEFLGRNGSWRQPAAMRRTHLSGRVGAGLDPCAAVQLNIELAEGQSREVIFRLGLGHRAAGADALAQRFRGPAVAHQVLTAVRQHWRHTLSAVQVETPDPAFDVLANGWLLYQTLACRIWARSGYYQSGGAFGFRDQLQDAMALVHCEPAVLRTQILRCAGRQFQEGDVQHWWHPPAGRGVRTRCSDDYLWLPLAVSRYVQTTGDVTVLDESAHFLEGRPVNPDDDSYYDLPAQSAEAASLYAHCVRAIEHGLRMGAHGLPLIGTGDWNDGMNLVGVHGKGESVWLAFFLCDVLAQFKPLALARGDTEFAARCAEQGEELRLNIEQHAWDGEWYRRAWFDDGSPLGSADSTECRIDSISQSWAVLSGAGNNVRAHQAMQSVEAHLVRREHGLIQLLDPPFDSMQHDPGYIRGYVPGVRENGGQYTHAAIWATMAFAALGDHDKAWSLLRMLNPINHTQTAQARSDYKVEPYVVAADVYAVAPHEGRGGWTWYTGSAGWMYRLMLESLLGLRRDGERLYLAPCLPAGAQSFMIHYRHGASMYHIRLQQQAATAAQPPARVLSLDGGPLQTDYVKLVDDQREHQVELRIHV